MSYIIRHVSGCDDIVGIQFRRFFLFLNRRFSRRFVDQHVVGVVMRLGGRGSWR